MPGEIIFQLLNQVFIYGKGKVFLTKIIYFFPTETLCPINGRYIVSYFCCYKRKWFGRCDQIIDADQLHVGWEQMGGLKKVGGIVMRLDKDIGL